MSGPVEAPEGCWLVGSLPSSPDTQLHMTEFCTIVTVSFIYQHTHTLVKSAMIIYTHFVSTHPVVILCMNPEVAQPPNKILLFTGTSTPATMSLYTCMTMTLLAISRRKSSFAFLMKDKIHSSSLLSMATRSE